MLGFSLSFNHVNLCLTQTSNQVTKRHRMEKERQFTALLIRLHIARMNQWPTQPLTVSWIVSAIHSRRKVKTTAKALRKDQRKEETLELRVIQLSYSRTTLSIISKCSLAPQHQVACLTSIRQQQRWFGEAAGRSADGLQWESPAHRQERSDAGLLVDEHGAACEGSVHFDLLRVGHRDQSVVLDLLVHLQETQWEKKPIIKKLDTPPSAD